MRMIPKAALALCALAGAAAAQDDFPTKPVTMVVGFSAGGGMDTLGRLVGERVGEELGQRVVVENRPGAGGTIAPAHVAGQPPDGYTLYLGETAALVGPVMFEDVGYDPTESFAPVAQLAIAPLALVANAEVPVASLEEFVEYVKASPGEYFYAAPGVATLQHLAIEQLKDAAGLEIDAVQFQGGSPSVQAVVSGEVPFAIVSLSAASAQADGGALNILGVTTAEPVPGFEDIPPISSVVEGFEAAPRQFVLVPAGTPEAVLDTLEGAFAATMEDPQLRDTLSARGFVPAYLDGDGLADELPRARDAWSSVAESVLAK